MSRVDEHGISGKSLDPGARLGELQVAEDKTRAGRSTLFVNDPKEAPL